MAELTDIEAAGGRRGEAVAAFNRASELIDSADRSAADDDEMLAAAFTSRYLWDAAGGDEQRAIGDWQIAHVASLLGYAELAVSRATLALERVRENHWTDWRLASCYEGMARAEAVAGHGARRDHWAALAREVLERLDDEEDRELIASQLASVPGVSLESAAERDARPDYRVARIDHVQVAMPQGRESEAEAFYGGLLGLEVRAKPPALAARGGRWFEDDDVKVHLGVEAQFRPAEKAHPGLVVEGLDRLVEALAEAGYPATWDTENPGARRCFVADPFGNRIELIDG